MSGEEREGRLGATHVAIPNIHAFRNESTHAESCGVTRGFLRNSCDSESSNSKQVLILRGKRPPEHLSFSASDGLSLSPSAEVSRQSGNPSRGESARCRDFSKRAATLWCARSGGPGPSAAARAPATSGSRTTGGAVVVRFAVEADCCGAVGCRRTDGLVELHVDGDRRVLCARCARRWSP